MLELQTVPNEPFRIPRLSLKGQYRLDNIRLVQAGELLAYAEPRSAAVLVTQILVTRVTSRPLTLEEIRSHGILFDGASTRACNFTFGFGVEGNTFDYNVPIVYWYPRDHFGPPRITMLGSRATGSRFRPPQMAAFTLTLRLRDGPQGGGCGNPSGCQEEEMPPLPGVLLFPTDLSLLHQFFEKELMAVIPMIRLERKTPCARGGNAAASTDSSTCTGPATGHNECGWKLVPMGTTSKNGSGH